MKRTSVFTLLLVLGVISLARAQQAVVLSGGGSRGIAHAGVLAVMEERGYDPDIVIGTSMGAVVGALYAAGYTAAEIAEQIRAIAWRGMFDPTPVIIGADRHVRYPMVTVDLDVSERLRLSRGLVGQWRINRVLAHLLFEANVFDRAQLSFDRVRLDGPFSNQELPRSGWAAMSAENHDRALVPWSVLVDRDVTDSAVQEALLALPYAYSKLNVHGRAALMYGRALETFSNELVRVDASIDSIRSGNFLKALVREEIRQNKDWVIRLRTLPETPETYYLAALMASHDFQTALQN